MIFAKKTSELEYQDIYDLVKIRQEREGQNLDYKEKIDFSDRGKPQLAKDISAFSNASGGFLIFGVSNNLEIFGIDPEFNSRSVIEWFNQIVSANIEPAIHYDDPVIIQIPEKQKVILVVYIPESRSKPHMVKEKYTYHIRRNDKIDIAKHYEIRDMFDNSRNRLDQFNSFLVSRNLLDSESEQFAENFNSRQLFSGVQSDSGMKKPIILFSLIPGDLVNDKIDISLDSIHGWFEKNSKGYLPFPATNIYYVSHDYEHKIDGIVLINHRRDDAPTSYFEILENGFVEAGFSSSFASASKNESDNNDPNTEIHLTPIVGYSMMFLGFMRSLFQYHGISEMCLFQISFKNVLNYKPYSIHESYDLWRIHRRAEVRNRQHQNFKIARRISPASMSDEDIHKIGSFLSLKICRVFGFNGDVCFVENNLSNSSMEIFKL